LSSIPRSAILGAGRRRTIVIGVGIIGAGGIARAHARAILGISDRARLFAAADTSPERLGGFSAEFSIPKIYGDYRELLADPDIRMVTICTPNGMHAGMAVAALEAGKAVLCEKPIAGSLSEVDAIIAAQARSGGFVSSIFQWRYGNGVSTFRGLLQQGICGRILWAQANVLWRRTAEYYTSGPWRGSWKGERGGPLMTLASHAIDSMASVMAKPIAVSAFLANFLHDVEVEDTAAAVVRFEDGSMASVNVTSSNQSDTSRLEFICEKACVSTSFEPYSTTKWPWTIRSGEASTQALIEKFTRDVKPDTDTDLLALQVRDCDKIT
jgi:predicted dehydrogenase